MIYFVCFCIVLILLALIIIYGKTVDINAALVIISIAVGNGGCYALSVSKGLEEAILANKLVYVMGAFAPMLAFLIVCNVCKVNIPDKVCALLYLVQMVIYITVCNVGNTDLFYKSIEYHTGPFGVYITKTYGVMHTVFMVVVLIYTVATVGVGLVSLNRKNVVSRLNVYILLLADVIVVGTYMLERMVKLKMELLSVSFTLAAIVMMIPLSKAYRYSTSNVWGIYAEELRNTGYIFFDTKLRFMGYNEQAAALYPELLEWEMEKKIPGNGGRFNTFLRQPLSEYIRREDADRSVLSKYNYKGVTYRYRIATLRSKSRKKIGYVIWVSDATGNQE